MTNFNEYESTTTYHTKDDLADKAIELQHASEELNNLYSTIENAVMQAEELVDYHREELGIEQVILADTDRFEDVGMEIECAADDIEEAAKALPEIETVSQDLVCCPNCHGTGFAAVPMLAGPLAPAYSFGTSLECDTRAGGCGFVLRFTEHLVDNGVPA